MNNITTSILKKKLEEYKLNSKYRDQIIEIGFFGSYAKGKSSKGSDIDIFISLKSPKMFDLIGIKQELEKIFGCKIDIVLLRDQMNPYLKKEINNYGIQV